MAPAPSIYSLRISLFESRPLIWRRVLVSGSIRLKKLHAILQATMGWSNSHVHEFVFPNVIYSDPEFELEEYIDHPVEDEASALLRKVASVPSCVFCYRYDFGDDWRHLIEVEWISEECPEYSGHPVCTAGEFASLPEDCGGIIGYYQEFLPALLDSDDREHESTVAWSGGEFDPEAFDIDEVNARLQAVG